MCGDALPSKSSLSSQHICNSLCFLPSACCWVWKRWICSPRVTDVVQIRHFNSSSSWTPNWPWETGNRRGQSVINPYSARGDCVCLCVMGSCSGSSLWAPLQGEGYCWHQSLMRALICSTPVMTSLTHLLPNTFCFALPMLPPFTFFGSRASPCWVV